MRNSLAILRGAVGCARALQHPAHICARTKRTSYPGHYRSERLANYLAVARQRLDILHVHFAGNLQVLLGIRKVVRIPVVISLLGSDVTSSEQYAFPEFLGLVPREGDELIAACEFLRDEFHRRTCRESAIHILPPEVPSSFFTINRDYRGVDCRFLTIARLHWKKGILYGLHAAHELKRRGHSFKYDIVGGGEDLESLKKAVDDMALQDIVTFHGSKDPSEIPNYLRRADIFLLPSVNEGAAGVLIEAQAAGLPIVSTRIGGVPEAVLEGKTGLLVPPRKPNEMADAMEALMLRPDLRQQFGVAGRQHAQQFKTETIGSELLSIYQSALERWEQRGLRHQGAPWHPHAAPEAMRRAGHP